MFDYTMNKYETISLKYSHLSKSILEHLKFRLLFSFPPFILYSKLQA